MNIKLHIMGFALYAVLIFSPLRISIASTIMLNVNVCVSVLCSLFDVPWTHNVWVFVCDRIWISSIDAKFVSQKRQLEKTVERKQTKNVNRMNKRRQPVYMIVYSEKYVLERKSVKISLKQQLWHIVKTKTKWMWNCALWSVSNEILNVLALRLHL